MKFRIRFFLLGIALFASCMVKAQVFSNDFENRNEWNRPWFNLHIVADSSTAEENFVCICDTIHEYGLGFGINVNKTYPNQNINCKFDFLFKADAETQADIVVSIDDTIRNRYWNAYPLANYVDNTAEWSRAQLDLNFPYDYIKNCEIKIFVWNKGKERLLFDDARLEVKTDVLPSYQPEIIPIQDSTIQHGNFFPIVEYINTQGDTINDPSVAEFHYHMIPMWNNNVFIGYTFKTKTQFKKDVKLLRLTIVQNLPEGEIIVYRRNQHIDSVNLQPSYYLDREGFIVKQDTACLCTYRNTDISSLQLDVEHRTACFNIDYWRDHPLLHYPMRNDTSDYFEDISYRYVKAGEVFESDFNIYHNAPNELPRLMPVWDGTKAPLSLPNMPTGQTCARIAPYCLAMRTL